MRVVMRGVSSTISAETGVDNDVSVVVATTAAAIVWKASRRSMDDGVSADSAVEETAADGVKTANPVTAVGAVTNAARRRAETDGFIMFIIVLVDCAYLLLLLLLLLLVVVLSLWCCRRLSVPR